MKYLIKAISIFFLIFLFTQCAEKEVGEQHVVVDIEGMTCEIGCANLIEAKLSKKEGVKSVDVVFVENKGYISYNADTISRKEVINTIEKIADGELYSVKKITKINVN